MSPPAKLGPRKLLIASLGVATINYVACNGVLPESPTTGNLMAPPPETFGGFSAGGVSGTGGITSVGGDAGQTSVEPVGGQGGAAGYGGHAGLGGSSGLGGAASLGGAGGSKIGVPAACQACANAICGNTLSICDCAATPYCHDSCVKIEGCPVASSAGGAGGGNPGNPGPGAGGGIPGDPGGSNQGDAGAQGASAGAPPSGVGGGEPGSPAGQGGGDQGDSGSGGQGGN